MDNTIVSQNKWGVYPTGDEYSVWVANELITYAQEQARALEIYHEALRSWAKSKRSEVQNVA